MPEPNEIIRSCVDAWTAEQEQIAANMAESIAAFEAYQQSLEEWQQELIERTEAVARREQRFELQRQEFIKQQATDVAVTAELDQVRAEVDDLRQQLTQEIPSSPSLASVAVSGNFESSLESATTSTTKCKAATETLELSMNSVANQFRKLRKQQAARRSSSSGDNPN